MRDARAWASTLDDNLSPYSPDSLGVTGAWTPIFRVPSTSVGGDGGKQVPASLLDPRDKIMRIINCMFTVSIIVLATYKWLLAL